MTEETRASPPACEGCGKRLPDGPDPLRRRISPEDALRKYSPERQPPAPVRVSCPGPGDELEVKSWWCSSLCFRKTFAKPEKKKKGKPGRDSQFHIHPPRAA